jgi:putative ABC transport system permease protein
VTLLVGAGLLLRSLERLLNVERGFNPAGVLTFQVSGGWMETMDRDAMVRRINGTIDAIASLPMMRSVATASTLPGVPHQVQVQMSVLEAQRDPGTPISAETRFVAPGYFDVLQIPLLGGELCRLPAIERNAVPEVMLNKAFVSRYIGNRSPLGLHLSGVYGMPPGRIVGVVGDARETGIDQSPPPVVYVCMSAPSPMPQFLARTNGDPRRAVNAVRLKVREIAPLRSVYNIAPLEEQIGDAFSQNRLRAIVLASFAVAALALACLGVYGTLSYIIALRQREIGLWLALGAMKGDVIVRFLGKALLVVGIACVAGLVMSLALSRLISGMLFDVAGADPATIAAVISAVMIAAVLAALLPSVRASALDPMRALREE